MIDAVRSPSPDKASVASTNGLGAAQKPCEFRPSVLSEAQLIRTIMDNSQDSIYFKDQESRFLLSSKAHTTRFGTSEPKDVIGKTDFDFYPKDFAENALRDEQDIMRTGRPVIGRVERWDKGNDEVIWFSASKYPLYDDSGTIIGTWGTTRDITDLKNAEKELEHVNQEYELLNNKLKELSVIDELSGLHNRRHFYDTLTKTMKIFARVRGRGYASTFSLELMDIDDFKDVNDTYGHLVGDDVIRHIANLLKKNTRLSDYVFRYGGDEFAVILPDTDRQGSKEFANRLRTVVEATPYIHHGSRIKLTISLGTATYSDQVDSVELVQEADMNLYTSKSSGKNRAN
jgi:diguanylate cyclase (GGDEF)-like protein/PAS domain S-box-containing protein